MDCAAFAWFGCFFPHIYLTILEFIIDSHSLRHILWAGGEAGHPYSQAPSGTLGTSQGLFWGRGLPCAGIIKMHNMARRRMARGPLWPGWSRRASPGSTWREQHAQGSQRYGKGQTQGWWMWCHNFLGFDFGVAKRQMKLAIQLWI